MNEAVVVSLAEFTCWDGERFRNSRKKIWFEIGSVGKIQGQRVRETFQADFSLMYDREDQATIECLSHVVPGIDWTRMIYWRNFVSQSIDVIDAETEIVLARIKVRAGVREGVGREEPIRRANVLDAIVYDLAEWRVRLRGGGGVES